MSEGLRDPRSDEPADWAQHLEGRPYRDGQPIKTGDRVAFVDIDGERTEGIARVDSAIGSGFYHAPTRETRITIIPDGEPMLYGRDFAFAEVLAEEDLKITATRWLPREPIPYDEMRRLCGLDPAVKAYCARRDADLAWKNMTKQLGEVIQHAATVWTEAIDQMLPGLRAFGEATKPKQTPPMWAHDPARQHRDTRSSRRVK